MAAAFLALSAIIFFADIISYRRYRSSLISSEQAELLTMARTVGTGLKSYLEQEIASVDTVFDLMEIEEISSVDTLREAARHIVDSSDGLYRGAAAFQNQKMLFSLGQEIPADQLPLETLNGTAGILGKRLSDSGWYEMFIGKRLASNTGDMVLVLSMDLNEVYRKMVAPVRIGQGGYSVVKDSDLAIIMHHAQNQIGMDALYDREDMYPDLDLTSLSEWLEMQRSESEGTGILDSYVWDDPDLPSVQRIAAYTTIDIYNERWIVNSTLPLEELADPLQQMIRIMAVITVLYLILIAFVVYFLTRALMREEAQRNEIEYLKEINRGMELISRQNDEIRHYQRVQSLGMMSSHIAHEFNNYLTPVMVYGELLENDDALSAENREIIMEMMKSVEQAAALSRELLDFSRIDSGGRNEAYNLSEEVREAVSIVRQLVPARISFHDELSAQPAWLMGRKGMAQHILMNLSKNAFHAMEETDRKELVIQYAVTGRKGILSVKDTGCGIPAENMKNIFEPFFTTKGSRQGTGLGLSVVRNLTERANGSISIESTPGEGTMFTMVFPVSPDPESLSSRQTAKDVRHTLCISKNEKALAAWQHWLDAVPGDRMNITEEASAVSMLKNAPERFDQVILASDLSSMTGIELAQIIRRYNERIRIVILSDSTMEDLENLKNNGIIDDIILP